MKHWTQVEGMRKFFLKSAANNQFCRRRMEETFLRMKLERDELIKTSNRDDTDGDVDSVNVPDEIADHASRQKKAYEPQFIEYVRSRLNLDCCS